MCIRDSNEVVREEVRKVEAEVIKSRIDGDFDGWSGKTVFCLLYTSDAADERSSVDLGGRRIIKKKTKYIYCD